MYYYVSALESWLLLCTSVFSLSQQRIMWWNLQVKWWFACSVLILTCLRLWCMISGNEKIFIDVCSILWQVENGWVSEWVSEWVNKWDWAKWVTEWENKLVQAKWNNVDSERMAIWCLNFSVSKLVTLWHFHTKGQATSTVSLWTLLAMCVCVL